MFLGNNVPNSLILSLILNLRLLSTAKKKKRENNGKLARSICQENKALCAGRKKENFLYAAKKMRNTLLNLFN